ncbi:glutaredoxin family protein [Thalassomonas haliotis]|uniref:Glutaredoxin family protein n=1 Tax=Thalassomonas haliotis TaxID=485448 RepID=A0ABY7VI04_9GAMM|nr:glutaredoxin family protein [Thalassomonas haliotis]WDE12656.1 glutaredoxin family protein [Thalassomonas haliotis]
MKKIIKDSAVFLGIFAVFFLIMNIALNKYNEKQSILYNDYSSFFAKTDSELIVYTADTCVVCKNLKNYLTKRNVEFEEREITQNEQYMAEFSAFNANVTPILLTQEMMLLGFHKQIVDEKIIGKVVKDYDGKY